MTHTIHVGCELQKLVLEEALSNHEFDPLNPSKVILIRALRKVSQGKEEMNRSMGLYMAKLTIEAIFGRGMEFFDHLNKPNKWTVTTL